MANKIRWGLLSTANINKALIPAIRMAADGELIAVASRDKLKSLEYARKWEIPYAFGGYDEMLESGMIDAVYISLPNNLHAEWSIKAMKAGLHVLCEKPFAISLKEVDAMIQTQKKTGRVLTEAFMYRHHPQTKKVKEIIMAGLIGEICLLRGTFDFSMNSRNNIRLNPAWGGGCLWDVGVYPVSFAQYVFGEPPKYAYGSRWIGESGVDETFCGQLTYSGNRFAQISAAFRSPWHTFIEIIGTQGRIHLNRPFTNIDSEAQIILYDNNNQVTSIPFDQKPLYLGQVEDMNESILTEKNPYLSLKETRNHVKTILALQQSANENRVIAI